MVTLINRKFQELRSNFNEKCKGKYQYNNTTLLNVVRWRSLVSQNFHPIKLILQMRIKSSSKTSWC